MTNQIKKVELGNDAFANFREKFPAMQQLTYLSVCDKMILHDEVRNAVDEFLDCLATASQTRTELESRMLSSKEKFADLINAIPSSIAAVRNCSDGLNTVAWAAPINASDNVILCVDAEHPNNIYPWLRLRERNVEVRLLGHKHDGSTDVDSIIAAMDSKTRLVTCSSVTFAPGHRTDLVRLGEACRKRGVFFLVDGVQSAGILADNMSDLPVDGYVTSTSKGLLGLYGYGFLYVSPNWIDRMKPAYLARSSVKISADDHSVLGGLDYEYQVDSKRFEVGSFNLAGAFAANASLGLLLDLGIKNIERHVLSLSSQLKESVAELGMPPAVPNTGADHSHIVTFGDLDHGGHGFSNDPKVPVISEKLNIAKIKHTIRRGQLRFAIHAYNNAADISHTAEVIGDALKDL